MSIQVTIDLDPRELIRLQRSLRQRVVAKAARRAGSTALRDMGREANRRVRGRKRLRVRTVRKALVPRRPAGGGSLGDLRWQLDVRGDPVALSEYPHRQTKRGVSVTVNRGRRTVIPSAFVASMRAGRGVFLRRSADRLPVDELLGSRPVDALMHEGEIPGVQARGQDSFVRAWKRLMTAELARS